MAVTLDQSGTTSTLSLDTETLLCSSTNAGTYAVAVDLANLANGDAVLIRVYGKPTATGDTERLMFAQAYAHAQAAPLVMSVPVMSPVHYRATIEQTDGTGRTFKWGLYKA